MTDSDWNPFADDSKEDIVTEVVEVSPLELGFTIKQAATTGAPWLTGKGPIEEVESFLSDKQRVKAVLDGIHDATEYFGGRLPQDSKASATASGGSAHSDAPNGEIRRCKHGQMQYRTGSKNGRVWQAFMCPTEKGTADQCPPEFIKSK